MLASIFNDVIGPVMRGPSSSHCAAALRIGRLARELTNGAFDEVLIEFDRNGSLPTTHDTQGSDMGFGRRTDGLGSRRTSDCRFPCKCYGNQVRVCIETVTQAIPHPNTYRLTLRHGHERRFLRAISTGGGMIEVLNVDALDVSMFGDCFETLLWVRCRGPELAQELAPLVSAGRRAGA